MQKWLVAVLAMSAFASCGNKVELSECTAIPPATFTASQCQMFGAEAKCTLSRLDTTSLPDGGVSTACHHENCESKPTCPSL